MDKLHIQLMKLLIEEYDRSEFCDSSLKIANHNVMCLAKQVDEKNDELKKITTERDGLYSDLDEKDEETKLLRARIEELERPVECGNCENF